LQDFSLRRGAAALTIAGMIPKLFLSLVAVLNGGWMLADGIHVLVTGKYFGPDKPGPWSVPFARLGVNPFSLGPVFILLGVLWLAGLAAVLTGKPWALYAAGAVAVASLWYLPMGTLLSAIYLVLLYFRLPQAG
jgi:hypothetical protein